MSKPANISDFFNQMLSKREYLIPIIAAQYQFPNHYYGLTSAALLEDLFVDAAINFKNQHHHGLQLERPERLNDEKQKTDAKGEKGWDYKYEGQNYSHKVGGKVQSIALLWDATYKLPEDGTYSYPSPMVMVLSNYKNKNAFLIFSNDKKLQISPLSQYRSKNFIEGQQVIIARRHSHISWEVLDVLELIGSKSEIEKNLRLQIIWQKMLDYWAGEDVANSVEIFVTKPSSSQKFSKGTSSNMVNIDFEALPGIYLFPKESLQNIKVTKNNRAILLPTEKVQELMHDAVTNNNFTYMPNWFSFYATNRSVDLYLVQRSEYDRLNTAARN